MGCIQWWLRYYGFAACVFWLEHLGLSNSRACHSCSRSWWRRSRIVLGRNNSSGVDVEGGSASVCNGRHRPLSRSSGCCTTCSCNGCSCTKCQEDQDSTSDRPVGRVRSSTLQPSRVGPGLQKSCGGDRLGSARRLGTNPRAGCRIARQDHCSRRESICRFFLCSHRSVDEPNDR